MFAMVSVKRPGASSGHYGEAKFMELYSHHLCIMLSDHSEESGMFQHICPHDYYLVPTRGPKAVSLSGHERAIQSHKHKMILFSSWGNYQIFYYSDRNLIQCLKQIIIFWNELTYLNKESHFELAI